MDRLYDVLYLRDFKNYKPKKLKLEDKKLKNRISQNVKDMVFDF